MCKDVGRVTTYKLKGLRVRGGYKGWRIADSYHVNISNEMIGDTDD